MKIRIIGIITLVVCILSGCFLISDEPYTFRQEFEQIVSIEILKKEYDSISPYTPMHVVKTVEPTMHQELINDLLKLEGGRIGLEPGTGFGVYIIRITYKDGEIEMLGDYNNGYITPDGKLHEDIYAFDSDQYYQVISNYLGEVITPPTLG